MMEVVAKTTHPEDGLTIFEEGYVKISEDFFWKAVALINWKWLLSNTSIVDKGMYKLKLLKKYDVEVWKKVKEVHGNKYKALQELLRSYDTSWRVGTGDDSTWDLCSHVVGLGREVYLNALTNPEHLIERGRTHDFKENFGYWIPTDAKCKIPSSVDFINKEN